MNLSGTVIVDCTVPDEAIGLGRSAESYENGRRRTVLALVAQHGQARVLVGVDRVAELVEDGGRDLHRVGAAELLLREADCERSRPGLLAATVGLFAETVLGTA